MKNELAPFNVEILDLRNPVLQLLKPTTSLDILDGATSNLNPEGLFSIEIYGRIGDHLRDLQFSYVYLNTTIFHPMIHRCLVKLKALYGGIMAGTAYAIWDEQEKDFLPSTEMEGETGYAFFVKHWADIVFKKTSSATRDMRIALVNKYKDRAFVDRILILPAGLRDVEMGDDGRITQDEVNDLYRRAIAISNTIVASSHPDSPTLNNARRNLQFVFNNIFDHFTKVISGKRGIIQDKWGSRRVFNGTSNVITAMNPSSEVLGSRRSLQLNDHVCGLYQHMKSLEPVAVNLLKNSYLSRVFGEVGGQAYLVNPKTLKAEYVNVPVEVYDRWNSSEGLSKVITGFSEIEARHRPVKIGDYYLALIYLGKDTFKIFSDIDELPVELNREDVKPITLCQLLYLAGYKEWNKYPSTITRYPIATIGSIYISTSYVKTTIVGEERWELGDDWERLGEPYVTTEFPITGMAFVDAMSPSLSRLGLLGADFDGDRTSKISIYTEEGIKEAQAMLGKKETYLNPEGGFKTSANISTVALVLHNITGD